METDLSTNCSTAPLTNDFLIRILGSLGAVSFGVCLVALCWLFCLKLYKQFLYRLAAYQVMASLFHASIMLCQFSFLDYNGSRRVQSVSCVAVGYLFLMAALMKVCFGSWITFHLFCFAILLKNMRKLEPLYVISSLLVPITIAFIPLITKSYGPSGEWCMVQTKKCDKNYEVGDIELIAVWFGPALVLLVLQCIAMLTMIITVYYRAHRKSGENVFGRDQNNVAFRQLLPLVAYPVLFCILIIPPLIARVWYRCQYFIASPVDVTCLSRCPHLQTLTLTKCGISSPCGLSSCSQLVELTLQVGMRRRPKISGASTFYGQCSIMDFSGNRITSLVGWKVVWSS
ncbi:hypothetical protein EMCRGX_G009336 [Ephydatia muelleri]